MIFNILPLHKLLGNKYFATILLFAFNTFYIVIDLYLTSPFKVLLMILCPFILIRQNEFISKTLMFAILYLCCVTLCALMHPESFRLSTLTYLSMFMMMYITFHALIWQDIWNIDYVLKLLKILILLYIYFFISQQLFLAIGIRRFPLLNLLGEPYLEVFKTNALSLEPSHSARILCVAFYAWLKLNEFKNGYKETIFTLWNNHRYFFIGFLYIMLAMGSGTAIIAILLLSFYFVKGRLFTLIPVLLLLVFSINEYVNFNPLNRALKVATAISSTDATQIQKADGSAYYRIAPIVNTITKSDITSTDFWFGKGIDSVVKNGFSLNSIMIGGIADYGFLSFLFLLLFVYHSAIRRFYCLESVFFLILMACTLGNGYYLWGMVMLFSIIKRFEK